MAELQLNAPVAHVADDDDDDVDDDDVDLRLELDDDEDFAIVKGDYASVIFQNLAEKYPVNAHIECKYTLTRTYEPNARDWIGLYKVGWSSPRDYKTYQWVIIPGDYKKHENNVAKVLFQAHTLPEDDGEFYQFCYVGGGVVRGASVPFQFKSPRGDDFVEIEGDEDLMIVRTKTAVLQENLEAAMKKEKTLANEKKKLETDKQILESKIKELDSYLEEKNEQVNDAEKLLEAREKELEEVAGLLHRTKEAQADLSIKVSDLEKTVQSKQEKIDGMKDAAVEREMEAMKGKQEMSTLHRHKDEVDEELVAAKTSLKQLREELDQARGMAQGLQKEKELYKTHFTSTEETLRSAHDEHQALKHLILVKESEIKTLLDQMDEKIDNVDVLKDAVDKEKQKSDKLVKKISATQECVLHLQDKLANANDRAKAAEECKLMLDEQMKAYIAAYEGSAKDLVDARGQIHDLKDQVKRKDKLLSENAEATARLQSSISEGEMERDAINAKIAALEADRKRIAEVWNEEQAKAESEREERKKMEREQEICARSLEVDGATGEVSSGGPRVNGATGEVVSSGGPRVNGATGEVVSSGGPQVNDESSSDAALHALRMVISHLEKRLEKKDKQMKKLTKSCVDLEHAAAEKTRAETELKKHVEDLKRRLNMGADEYKKKWIECKKLQKKMEKIKKEHCVSESDMETSQALLTCEGQEEIDDVKLRMEQIKEKKNKFKQLYESECLKNASLRLEVESLRSLLEKQQQQQQQTGESGGDDDVIMKQPSPTSALTSSPAQTEKPRLSEAPSSPCLKPLPPPMIPVLLPSAKISALRSYYDLPPSPKELEETLLASAVEHKQRMAESCGATAGATAGATPGATADGETGIPEDVVVAEEKEEFFLAPEPAQRTSSPPPPPTTASSSSSAASPSSITLPKMAPLRSNGPSTTTTTTTRAYGADASRMGAATACQPPPLPPKRSISVPQEHDEVALTVCDECSFVFPRNASDQSIANHIQEHAGRLCPVCSQAFPSEGEGEQKAFEDHVQNHFEDPGDDSEDGTAGRQEGSPVSGFEFV